MANRETQRLIESRLAKQFITEYNKRDSLGIYTLESKHKLAELEAEAMYLYVENEISARFYNLVFKPKAQKYAKFHDINPYYYNEDNIRNAHILYKKYAEKG